ncbi:helix-turn-helix domain-containing protein [Synechococcus elongatus]|uniref:Helix-turn-helix transcriptional regulator n=1 Tax=Synechococcus elongatus PCC 11801 TaxID=2219813 RepID=A0AAN1UTP1_SYNEL|nr:helix-turn-helix transcriptional regulator [Synechococcus elongatus]AZB71737.1 XRE family transcriptional regulator [Synechococcus elongatus PCC 11801]
MEAQLRQWMQAQGLASWRSLARQSGVSERVLQRLRQGQGDSLTWRQLTAIAAVLQIEVAQLVEPASVSQTAAAIASRGDREAFEQDALHRLEPWLLNWPRAAWAAQQRPELPAERLLPLLQPLEQLLKDWQVETLGAIGQEFTFDPQWQLLRDGQAELGDRVVIWRPGYRWRDRLIQRAEVDRLP